jgi:hypothetical protein
MGEVWRAVDTSHDGRVVALKLLGTPRPPIARPIRCSRQPPLNKVN